MEYRVRLAERAVSDLAAIYREKNAEISPPAARWFLGMRDAVLSLKTSPLRGALTSESSSLRHLLYGKKPHVYRIIYSVDDDAGMVNVAQIRHGARQPFTR